MLSRKNLREKGKVSFTKYLQSFEKGDSISLVGEAGSKLDFPERMQGRTGVVLGKRGRAYVVEVSDLGLKKQFMVKPLFLRKLVMKK